MTTGIEKLDSLIRKARMEFYKPIQVAEVLHHDRVGSASISGLDLEEYRVASRGWRDQVTLRLIGKRSTSSARYQDDVWGEHAMPPWALTELLEVNRETGDIERLIYSEIGKAWQDFVAVRELIGLEPSRKQLEDVLSGAWSVSPSSTDRVVEILALTLLNAELRVMKPRRRIELDGVVGGSPLSPLLEAVELEDLAFERLGHTNAADAGMDIWSNFGVVVSIKNRRVTRDLFEVILDETPVGDLLIVCREIADDLDEIAAGVERAISIVTLGSLIDRSEKTLASRQDREHFAGDLQKNFDREFPQAVTFPQFLVERGY